MPLIRSTPPPAVRKAMLTGLPHFLRPGEPDASFILDATEEHFYSLRAFTLGLGDLKGPGIRRAREAGWRFLVKVPVPPFPAVAGVITQTRPGVRPRMTSLLRGPQVADVLQFANELQFFPEVQGWDYELAMLSVPGLLIEGFWLKAKPGGTDQMVPFHSVCEEVQVRWAYTMDKCIDIMRPLADKFLAFGH